MSFFRYKKFGNKEYAYKVITYWNKESKKVRQKIKYLGVLADKEKKVFQKPKDKHLELILDFGDGYTIYEFLKQTGIEDLIKGVFESNAEELKVMIAYRLCEGLAMRHLPVVQGL